MSSGPSMARARIPVQVLKPYWIATLVSFILIQCLFLGNMSYLYGTFFKSTDRSHAFSILFVDYDGGAIGNSLSLAYSSLEGDNFPTLHHGQSAAYPLPSSLRDDVCKGTHWAAIYTHENASQRLSAVIQGDEGNATYDPTDTITYIYNGARYPAISDSIIEANVQTLVSVARSIYGNINGSAALAQLNMTDKEALAAFYDPFSAKLAPIQSTTQGTRVLINTVSMVMPILMQFFFLMATNGISSEMQISQRLQFGVFFGQRFIIASLYGFISSLAMTGYIWAFRESWSVSAGQFFETWMVLWLYMDINYVIIDSVLGTIVAVKAMPFFMLTWIIPNVASTICPFELSPGFYRLGYALPAHEVYTLLVGIWSNCPRDLRISLPVLLSWWLLGHATSFLACLYRHRQSRQLPKVEMETTELTRISLQSH
ncbi:hypothetical protein E8E14_003754 [Neopestalotiopsis sp. 37M]|nr:hypothetical protein E8E14_003754 [Neopestalotiopsis sp. 37M]